MKKAMEVCVLAGFVLVLLALGCSKQPEQGEEIPESKSEQSKSEQSKSEAPDQRIAQLRSQLASSNSTDRIAALKAVGEIGSAGKYL